MSSIKAPSVALIGPPGSGKTYSLITLLEAGIEVFDIVTEPNGLDTILDTIRKHPDSSKLMSRFHWTTVVPSTEGWDAMSANMTKVGKLQFNELAKSFTDTAKSPDLILKLIGACNNFICERTGKSFGDVGTWDDTRALVVDSLSGINRIARYTAVGAKPTPAIGEWGVMMNIEDNFVTKLCSDCRCYFTLICHINKAIDEVSGMTTVNIRAITNSMGGELGKNFSEIVLAKRIKDQFLWSTSEATTDVKNRALPISESLAPSFAPIVEAHEARKRAAKLDDLPLRGGHAVLDAAARRASQVVDVEEDED